MCRVWQNWSARGRWAAVGIGQRVLDRQAHVRRGQLREHRAVHEFDHRMHDALRMHDHADARHFDVEQPARFDHFEPLVEQRGGIDRDLAAHDPRRMFKRAFDGDRGKLFLRQFCRNGPPMR